jgi:hypothetical protein
MPFKTTVISGYYSNYQSLSDVVKPNAKKYCEKQGYELACQLLPDGVPYGYWKLEFTLWALKYGNTDLVLCMDLDTLITNHNIRVDSFLDTDHDFYVTCDVNGINTGVFIIRKTDWAIEFLEFILSHRFDFDNEQVAIDHFKEIDHWKEKIKMLPHPSINSYPYDHYAPSWGVIGDRKIDRPTHEEGDWRPSDFICHLPGMSLEKRLEIFTKLQEEIIL